MPRAVVTREDAARYALLAAALAPFIALVLHSHPTNDDYVLTMTARDHGVLACNAFWYLRWVGRYTATAFQCMNPLVFGSNGWLRAFEAASLLGLGAAAYAFVSTIAPRPTTRPARLAIALFLVAAHLQQLPSIVEYSYTMTAVTVYELGDVLLLLAVAAYVHAERGGHRVGWTVVAALLAFLGAGTNELTMLLLDGFFALAAVERLARRRSPWLASAVLAAALVGTAGVVLAPGTAQRLGFSSGPGLAAALSGALGAAVTHAGAWLAGGPLLPAAVLLAFAAAATARETRWDPPHPAFTGVAALAAYLASFVPSFFGTGKIEPRTANVVHLVLAAGLLYHAVVLGRFLALRDPKPFPALPRAARAALYAAVVLLALATPSSNVRLAYADLLSGRAARFDEQITRRYELLATCRTPVCVVPRLTDRPRTLQWFEDAIDWQQDTDWFKGYKTRYAQYFGKAAILLPP